MASETIDTAALEDFLINEFSRREPLTLTRHSAGYSNPTYFLEWGKERWVLRTPPPGNLLPTSHDVIREWRAISALYALRAPVPKPIAACQDASLIGVPFYIMERVDGVVIRGEVPPALGEPQVRREVGRELMRALANLHSLEWRDTDLASLGSPVGYLERQISRWSRQLQLAQERTRPLPGIEEVTSWLQRECPGDTPARFVHGDYKLDNVVFAGDPPARLRAVLDWELCSLGDPLADVGYCLSFWGTDGIEDEDAMHEQNMATGAEGFPTRQEMAGMYSAFSGAPIKDLPFYVCLAVWKRAIIAEGLYALFLEGRATNRRTALMEKRVPALIKRIHRIIEKGSI